MKIPAVLPTDPVSHIRKVAGHMSPFPKRWHFPSILISYDGKACLGGKQLSPGELGNSKCQMLFRKIRKATEL